MSAVFLLSNLVASLFAGIFGHSLQGVSTYCMASICVVLLRLCVRLVTKRDSILLDWLFVPVAYGVSYILPEWLLVGFTAFLSAVGAVFRVLEPTLGLNVLFKLNRRLREEIEEQVNISAVLLIIIAFGFLIANGWLMLRIWAIYSKTSDLWLFWGLVILILIEAAIIGYTIYLAAMDCSITTASGLSFYLTYCLFRYAMQAVEPECILDNFTIANMFGRIFGQMFGSNIGTETIATCVRFYLTAYALVPLTLTLLSPLFSDEYLMIYDQVQVSSEQKSASVDTSDSAFLLWDELTRHGMLIMTMVLQSSCLAIPSESFWTECVTILAGVGYYWLKVDVANREVLSKKVHNKYY